MLECGGETKSDGVDVTVLWGEGVLGVTLPGTCPGDIAGTGEGDMGALESSWVSVVVMISDPVPGSPSISKPLVPMLAPSAHAHCADSSNTTSRLTRTRPATGSYTWYAMEPGS